MTEFPLLLADRDKWKDAYMDLKKKLKRQENANKILRNQVFVLKGIKR